MVRISDATNCVILLSKFAMHACTTLSNVVEYVANLLNKFIEFAE